MFNKDGIELDDSVVVADERLRQIVEVYLGDEIAFLGERTTYTSSGQTLRQIEIERDFWRKISATNQNEAMFVSGKSTIQKSFDGPWRVLTTHLTIRQTRNDRNPAILIAFWDDRAATVPLVRIRTILGGNPYPGYFRCGRSVNDRYIQPDPYSSLFQSTRE